MTAEDTVASGMTVKEWLALLGEHLPSGAPDLTADEIRALLELASVAAHSSERIAAPLSTFLVGAALRDADRAGLVATLTELTSALRMRAGAGKTPRV